MSDQITRSSRWWPNGTGSTTFSLFLYARTTEGVGTYGNLSSKVAAATTLAVVYPTGRDEGLTAAALVDAMVQYLLNAGVDQWYSPPNGMTVAEALYKAFDGWNGPTLGTTTSVSLFFDGQFGRVRASV